MTGPKVKPAHGEKFPAPVDPYLLLAATNVSSSSLFPAQGQLPSECRVGDIPRESPAPS